LTVTWVAEDGVGVGGVVGSLELVDVLVLVEVEVEVEVEVLVAVVVLDEVVLDDVVVGVGVGVTFAPAK